jgi:hypothetical protein
LNWKKTQLLCIFYALFVCTFCVQATLNSVEDSKNSTEHKALLASNESENVRDSLSIVLLKNLKNNETQKKILNDLRTFVPNGKEDKYKSFINDDLLNSLYENQKESNILLNEIMRFCSYMYEKTDKLSIPFDEKLRIETRVDELKSAAESFGMQNNALAANSNLQDCRVLEVNDNLGVVIIPVGIFDGIRVGRSFVIPNADEAKATVVAVRQFVSAAIITDGQLKDISPGMTVSLRN